MFDNLSLNEACQEQHEMVIQKGFTRQPIATDLMLIVTELGEACEADRKNRHADYYEFVRVMERIGELTKGADPERAFKAAFEVHIKDSFEDEIADAFLRLMDLCGAMDIDIEKHIRLKAEYNLSRPPKHGKEY
jgi:NTP pyrophosphatase (non-canonical NTP hydrolase)